MTTAPNIVLVHGAWADGSCWSTVIERLQADGYKVTDPQLPETSLADHVARVRHVLTRQGGPPVLVGHSVGGQVITSLGTDTPNAVGLVCIAGFGLDEGESIGALLQQCPPTPAVANIDGAEYDEVISPEAERQFAKRMGADTMEVASGHCAMVSHPEETYQRIVTAANAAAVPA